MGRRLALIIGNSRYDDSGLARLATPDVDVRDLAGVLRAPDIGHFDDITELSDEGFAVTSRAIAQFFSRAKRDDLLVFYFSGHGVKDENGHLYLAVRDTEVKLLAGTSIESAFVTAQMDRSYSRRQVLILDCCHSGAFAPGAKGAIATAVGVGPAFEGTGFGHVVLTATDSTQYAWEGDQVIGESDKSVFTHYLLQGLKTGEADRDGDGLITIDELYDYVYEQVVRETPRQTPGKWSYKQQGDIVLARNPSPIVNAAELPLELQALLESPLARLRAEAVGELAILLEGRHPGLALAASRALEQLGADDSRRVSAAAEEVLAAHRQAVMDREAAAVNLAAATRARDEQVASQLDQALAAIAQKNFDAALFALATARQLHPEAAGIEALTREVEERQQEQARAAAARERAAREEAAREQAAREQAAREQAAREQAAREQAAREQATREQAAREQAAREQAAREQAAREQAAREQAAREHAARERAAQEQEAREQAAREKVAREREASEQEARALEAQVRAVREQEAREREAREQQAREQAARERQERERQEREQQARALRAREARELQARATQAREPTGDDLPLREPPTVLLPERSTSTPLRQRRRQLAIAAVVTLGLLTFAAWRLSTPPNTAADRLLAETSTPKPAQPEPSTSIPQESTPIQPTPIIQPSPATDVTPTPPAQQDQAAPPVTPAPSPARATNAPRGRGAAAVVPIRQPAPPSPSGGPPALSGTELRIATLLRQGDQLLEARSYEAAIGAYEEAGRLGSPNGRVGADKVRAERTQQVRQRLVRAERLLDTGEYDDALRVVDEALALDPRSTDSRELRQRVINAQNFERSLRRR